MQPHPVPQNVTAFQFKLVGDMTLKQFLYLAFGVGTAYLFFVLLAAPFPILAWPMIVFFSFLGIAFAFIPISNRPFDHWVKAYLKAVYSPTKLVWQKEGKTFSENPLFQNRLNVYFSTKLPEFTVQPQIQPIQPSAPAKLPESEDLTKTVKLAHEAQALQIKIIQTERELSQVKTETSEPGTDKKETLKEFNSVFNNLQKLVEEAQDVKNELSQVTKQDMVTEVPKAKISIVIPSKTPTKLPLLTSSPNVINGIITDSAGNYLESAVVVIHDKDGLPVRALKTNKLGQFTGATPLPNGVYTIETEKENLSFDVLQMELSGAVLPPLQIAAKKLLPG